ncbi:hypothetical protein [Mesorhizobium sp. B2-8-3]|uniref:hypothetical protein n=1 Tax=Mesorhizobium sp. B2-8-3 TaxID=2589905 RepID=UPI0011268360|nr:hypothetical protein [Mesorhizobium sp. B2-8-3]TPJ32532.1 hypothetical protein FJ418_17470 [Mesorhizobium sp. B2-8-3]
MNRTIPNDETERVQNAVFGGSRHNGGILGHDFSDLQYGRRVEFDHSWTVYHVFTGIPAYVDGVPMVGLTHAHATRRMLDLNRRNAEGRKEWNGTRLALEHTEMRADQT